MIKGKTIFSIILMCFFSLKMLADDFVVDTLFVVPDTLIERNEQKEEKWIEKFSKTHFFQATYLGTPLIAAGLLEQHYDQKFRRLRTSFLPTFKDNTDDYLQYLPAAVMLGMKAAGVKGRSSWGRMLLSDAISAAIMSSAVNTLKYTVKMPRPDGSANNSFPSGHTATAFMTATMLNKEYGHLAPWVGVGAYSVATATGLMRMANNKHWLSDVMVGAGIGILSAELGYWLADIICKEKCRFYSATDYDFEPSRHPSFLGLYMGFNIPLSRYDLLGHKMLETAVGTTAGVEGAYFFNRYVGIGGRWTMSNVMLIVDDNEAYNDALDFCTLMGGAYFNLPLSRRWAIGSKLLVGAVNYSKLETSDFKIGANRGFGAGTGMNIGYHVKKHLSMKIFLDYNILPPHSKTEREYMHTMTLGSAVSMRF